MEIPNLTQPVSPKSTILIPVILVLAFVGIGLGFGLSRITPKTSTISPVTTSGKTPQASQPISSDSITDKEQIKVNQIFGDTDKAFKDSATGSIEKGSINGEGTHILVRPGGLDQRASLTSSVIDLDLFVGRKVEIKGETNSSNKTGWLMDVGWLKVTE